MIITMIITFYNIIKNKRLSLVHSLSIGQAWFPWIYLKSGIKKYLLHSTFDQQRDFICRKIYRDLSITWCIDDWNVRSCVGCTSRTFQWHWTTHINRENSVCSSQICVWYIWIKQKALNHYSLSINSASASPANAATATIHCPHTRNWPHTCRWGGPANKTVAYDWTDSFSDPLDACRAYVPSLRSGSLPLFLHLAIASSYTELKMGGHVRRTREIRTRRTRTAQGESEAACHGVLVLRDPVWSSCLSRKLPRRITSGSVDFVSSRNENPRATCTIQRLCPSERCDWPLGNEQSYALWILTIPLVRMAVHDRSIYYRGRTRWR